MTNSSVKSPGQAAHKQAQVAADYVRKGSLIGVVGRMTTEQ